MKLLLLLGVVLFSSCATRTPQTDALVKVHPDLPSKAKVQGVPFIAQTKNHCGPASLAMMLEHASHPVNVDELVSQMMTPKKEGTFQTDLITATRRQGMLAVRVSDLQSILKEISLGNPVLVFQNLGFESLPQWHYSVATGYNLDGPDIIFHSGSTKNDKSDMRFFERSFILGGNWALVVLEPGKLSPTANELAHSEGAAGLEQTGKLLAAEKSYLAILEKWPKSLTALLGMGNVKFSQEEFKESEKYLIRAVIAHSQSAMAWHNLAIAQGRLKLTHAARESSLKAMALASLKDRAKYQESLKAWLR